MADPEGELTVAQRLGRALDQGLLPAGGPAEAAERLIERLERPARVALLGLPGSGKSSILNLLVGTVVVPETLRLPTIIVQHGPEARMICTLTDGTSKTVPGSDLAQVLALAPALVTLELDLPALKVISLLEVSAGPMEPEQRRAATWASKRADIVIWCTTSYLPKEQVVWESLPDGVKDNSFMFLTKVDLLGSRESASAMHDRVEQRAGEEFRQILSISAKQARAAMPPGGPVNRDMFRDSGASGVIAAIKTRVQSGRRADMDTAELLLARHVEASELVARRFAEPEAEAAAGWTPPIEAGTGDSRPEEVTAEEGPAAVEPEAMPEPEEAEEAEVPEDEVQAAVEKEVEAEPEVEPVVSAGPEPEPEAVEESEAEPEPGDADEDEMPIAAASEPAVRKRFADRIKRVAASAEPASAPKVPLRSTWKSKAELEAAAAEPAARGTPPARRPPAGDEDEAARPVSREAAATGRGTASRERVPRGGSPAPAPAAEAPRSARPQLFGAKPAAAGARAPDNPLPDLSALRDQSWSEESEEDDPVTAPETEDQESDFEALDQTSVPEPEPEVEAQRPVSRPRLFDREPRVRPAGPVARPASEADAHGAPVPRSPAPPRVAPAVAAAQASAAATPASPDESQFSPRAIMMREPRVESDAPQPRRERIRIAAQPVAAAQPEAAPVPVGVGEVALLDEAIGLIVSRSAELEQEIDFEAKVPVDLVLEHSRETTEQLISVLSRGRSGELRRINGDLGEILDVIMLMQLEKGHAPADDALTLLLQLRRELETLRAA